MLTFWAVRHERRDVYLAPTEAPETWTADERQAQRFTTEDAAINTIIVELNGLGRAVLVSTFDGPVRWGIPAARLSTGNVGPFAIPADLVLEA